MEMEKLEIFQFHTAVWYGKRPTLHLDKNLKFKHIFDGCKLFGFAQTYWIYFINLKGNPK